jgi:hypothetical protein
MASSSQSSARASSVSPSSTQVPGPSFLTTMWQRFELDPETKFDIVGEFREYEDVKWARKQFKKRHLMPLLQPVYHLYHPRFVRLFYQNLKFDTDQPEVLSSSIDGVEFQISPLETWKRHLAAHMRAHLHATLSLRHLICT